jgi:regulatory protein
VTITDMRRVRGSLYEVELDGEPAGKVDRRTMDDAGWRVDSTLTQRQWEDLLELSTRNRCKDKALFWLSLRDRSRGELLRKLKEEYDADLAGETVDRLAELGLLDDESLAARWAAELVRRKHFSRRRVEQELLLRGFDRETARQAAAGVETDDGEQALAILRKKYYNHMQSEDGRRKAAAALMRYGFSRDAVRRAFEDWENED